MIRTIIFDLGKVLVPFDFERGFAAIAPFCSCPPPEIRKRLAATDLVNRFESGLVEPSDFVAQLQEMLDMRAGYQEFCTAWSSIFLPETLIPESWVAALGERYRLLLLSNTNAIHFEMIRESYPIVRHFDGLVLSYEVKAMKPSPRIYEAAMAKAGCRAAECFYTDDIAEYVAAGRAAGMDAVQFVSAEQLRRELEQRGVTWD